MIKSWQRPAERKQDLTQAHAGLLTRDEHGKADMRLALSDSESSGSDVSDSETTNSRASSSKDNSKNNKKMIKTRRTKSKSHSSEEPSDSEDSDDAPPVNLLSEEEEENNEDDDDDDESEEDSDASYQQQNKQAVERVASSPSNTSSNDVYDDDEDMQSQQPEPVRHQRQSLAQIQGQNNTRNKVMLASLFQSRAPPQQQPPTHSKVASQSKTLSLPAVSSENQARPSALLLKDAEEPPVAAAAANVHTVPPLPKRAPRAPKPLQRVPGSKSVIDDASKRDPSARLARSFNVAWGPDGLLVRPDADMLTKPATVQLAQTASVNSVTTSSLDTMLNVKLAHTTFSLDEAGIPQASSLPTLRFSHLESSGVHKDVFSLGHRLFDPLGLSDLPQDATQAAAITSHARRAALLDWWTANLSTSVEQSLRQAPSSLEGTFALLTGFQVARATDSAIDQHDFRLATLVSQAGTADATFKTDVHNQLQKWRHLDMSSHIDKPYRAIMSLLAGHEPPASLDWKRRLACTLFYHSHELGQALQSYVTTDSGEEDFSYELIKLFCRLSPALEHTLLAERFPGSATVEKDCLAWLTHQLVAKVHRFADFEEEESSAAQLAVSVAGGLEQCGLWHWAVFVLLHLNSSASREKTIKNVLGRHAAVFTDETLSALDSFSVPPEWVAEAQARLALAEGDRLAAFQLFLRADLFSEAHELMVWDIAPEAVVAQDLEMLDQLLGSFRTDGGQQQLYVRWSEGGHFFQTYLQAVQLPDALRRGHTELIEQLRAALPALLVAIPQFLIKRNEKQRSLVREAAVSEMLATWTRIWALLDPSGTGDAGVSVKDMSDPVDYVSSLAASGFEQALQEAVA